MVRVHFEAERRPDTEYDRFNRGVEAGHGYPVSLQFLRVAPVSFRSREGIFGSMATTVSLFCGEHQRLLMLASFDEHRLTTCIAMSVAVGVEASERFSCSSMGLSTVQC